MDGWWKVYKAVYDFNKNQKIKFPLQHGRYLMKYYGLEASDCEEICICAYVLHLDENITFGYRFQ